MHKRGTNVTAQDVKTVKELQSHGLDVKTIASVIKKGMDTTHKIMMSENYEDYKTRYCGTHHKQEQEATKEERAKEELETPTFEIVEKSDWDAMIRFFKRLADNTNGIDDNMHKVAERQDKIWNVVLVLDKKIETAYTKLETICKELGV